MGADVRGHATPTFTSASTVSLTEGSARTFAVTVSDSNRSNFTWRGSLPFGMTLINDQDANTATLSGTPEVGTAGSYTETVLAVDAKGAHASQTLHVTVHPINSSVPLVDIVTPPSNSASHVTISGKNFLGATSVLFGSTSAPFSVNSSGTSIDATVPTHGAGAVDVTVVGPTGTSPTSLDDRFTFSVAPQAPGLTNVSPGGLSLFATWNPSDTSDAVTGYTLSAAVDAGFPGTVGPGCASPKAVSLPAGSTAGKITVGACSGVAYDVSLTSTNASGTSAAATWSAPAVPLSAQVPFSPIVTFVLARPKALLVAWTPPTDNGGASLGAYTLTATPTNGTKAVSASVPGTTTQFQLGGLTNGMGYRISLTAQNSAGHSLAASGSGTPSSTAKPGPPTGLSVVPDGKGAVAVSWTPPIDSGASGLTGFALTYKSVKAKAPSTGTLTLSASARSVMLTKLVKADFYTFSIVAKSALGAGPALATRSTVSPTIALVPSFSQRLSAGVMAALQSEVTDRSRVGKVLTWPATTVFSPPLTPGQVIVGTSNAMAPDGIQSVVQSVRHDGSVLLVDVTPATLLQTYRIFSYSYTGFLPASQSPHLRHGTAAGHAVAPGVTFTAPSNAQCLTLPAPFTAGSSACVLPSLSASASADCTRWVHIVLLGDVCYSWSLSASASASLSAWENLTAQLSGTQTIPLSPLWVPCIPIFIGCISVTVSPQIILAGTVTLHSSAMASISGTVSYNSGSGFSKSGSSGSQVNGPLITATGSGSATLQIDVSICAYGLCANIRGTGTLSATFSVPTPPYFKLCASVAVSVGMSINILFWSGSTGLQQVYSHSFLPCFTITNNGPITLGISPPNATVLIGANVQTYTSSRSDSQTPIDHWSLVGAPNCDSITASTGVLSTCMAGTFQVRDNDTFTPIPVNNPAQTNVTVGNSCAFSAPPGLTFGQSSQIYVGFFPPPPHYKTLTGHVTYGAPTNHGCTPLNHYLVAVSGPMGNFSYSTASNTSPTFPVLVMGTYTISVRGVNNSSVIGPASQITWIQTH